MNSGRYAPYLQQLLLHILILIEVGFFAEAVLGFFNTGIDQPEKDISYIERKPIQNV